MAAAQSRRETAIVLPPAPTSSWAAPSDGGLAMAMPAATTASETIHSPRRRRSEASSMRKNGATAPSRVRVRNFDVFSAP